MIENLKVWCRNWKFRKTRRAVRHLIKAMQDDPSFAHSWQCNIAMPIYDNANGRLTLEESNYIADKLMAHLFEVRTPTCNPPDNQ